MSARVPVTLIGRRGDAVDSALAFLEGNQVAVRWIDLDRDPLVPMLADDDLAHASLPLAIFADGSVSKRHRRTSSARRGSIAKPWSGAPPARRERRGAAHRAGRPLRRGPGRGTDLPSSTGRGRGRGQLRRPSRPLSRRPRSRRHHARAGGLPGAMTGHAATRGRRSIRTTTSWRTCSTSDRSHQASS